MKYKSKNIKPSSVPANLIKEKGNGIKIKVYIKDQMIGTGKMDLFRLVFKKGSIRAAAKFMGMSEKSLLPSEEFRRYIYKSYFRKKRW